MPTYSCVHCNFTTNLKNNYIRHLNTNKHKNKIKQINTNLNENNNFFCKQANLNTNEHKMNTNQIFFNEGIHEGIHECSFCNKLFKTKASMRRHEKHYCKNNEGIMNELKLIKEKKQLYKQIEKLLENRGHVVNNYTTNTINNTNNIMINSYGTEDLSHLSNTLLDKLIQQPIKMIGELTRIIHFNDDKPENMNIYIPNKRDKYIKVYKNGKWVLEDKKITIPDLVDKNYTILDSHYENFEQEIDAKTKSFFKFVQDGIDNKQKEIMQNQCDLVELEILNGSKKVVSRKNNEN